MSVNGVNASMEILIILLIKMNVNSVKIFALIALVLYLLSRTKLFAPKNPCLVPLVVAAASKLKSMLSIAPLNARNAKLNAQILTASKLLARTKFINMF